MGNGNSCQACKHHWDVGMRRVAVLVWKTTHANRYNQARFLLLFCALLKKSFLCDEYRAEKHAFCLVPFVQEISTLSPFHANQCIPLILIFKQPSNKDNRPSIPFHFTGKFCWGRYRTYNLPTNGVALMTEEYLFQLLVIIY